MLFYHSSARILTLPDETLPCPTPLCNPIKLSSAVNSKPKNWRDRPKRFLERLIGCWMTRLLSCSCYWSIYVSIYKIISLFFYVTNYTLYKSVLLLHLKFTNKWLSTVFNFSRFRMSSICLNSFNNWQNRKCFYWRIYIYNPLDKIF